MLDNILLNINVYNILLIKLLVTQDQLELYFDTFLEIDINYDGYIDYKQILSYYDILPSVYTEV